MDPSNAHREYANYALVFTGQRVREIRAELEREVSKKIKALNSISPEKILFLDAEGYLDQVNGDKPLLVVAVHFGERALSAADTDALKHIVSNGSHVFPIVDSPTNFGQQTPTIIQHYNGSILSEPKKVAKLTNDILGAWSLLPRQKKVFVSYKRADSTAIANQLHHALTLAGYHVFLDSISILSGTVFQDHLWHEMLETDLVVLLSTENFFESTWTRQEVARANELGITLFQILWPSIQAPNWSDLSISYGLERTQFKDPTTAKFSAGSKLTESALLSVINELESVRVRSIVSKRDRLIVDFMTMAENQLVQARYSAGTVTLKRFDGQTAHAIPIIGHPKSNDLHKAWKSKGAKSIVLHSDQGALPDALDHLEWLNTHLPLRTVSISRFKVWLELFKSGKHP